MKTITAKFAKFDKISIRGSNDTFLIEGARWNPWANSIEYRLIDKVLYTFEEGFPEEYTLLRDGTWFLEVNLTLVEPNSFKYKPRNIEMTGKIATWCERFMEGQVFFPTVWKHIKLNRKWPCWLQRAFLISFLIGLPIFLFIGGLVLMGIVAIVMMTFIMTWCAIEVTSDWAIEVWKCKC
jgi:hypothetical protein